MWFNVLERVNIYLREHKRGSPIPTKCEKYRGFEKGQLQTIINQQIEQLRFKDIA